MALARRPAAYLPLAAPGGGAAASPQAMDRAARRRGWPAPVIYAEGDPGPAAQPGSALGHLEAAIESGRHDALLLPLPPALGDAAALMRFARVPFVNGPADRLVIGDLRFDRGRGGGMASIPLGEPAAGACSEPAPWIPPRLDLLR